MKSLQRISDSPGNNNLSGEILPSWSWMAYDGAIDYLDPPFGSVDWKDGISAPWMNMGQAERVADRELKATAYPFKNGPVKDEEEEDFEVVFDSGDRVVSAEEWLDWKCVVMGTRRVARGTKKPVDEITHYLLVIAPSGTGHSYWRIGVGKMAGAFIEHSQSVEVLIQ